MNKKYLLLALIFIVLILGVYWVLSKKLTVNDTNMVCSDSDGGKNIYAAGSAVTKKGSRTLHISSDSCATHVKGVPSSEAQYIEGLASCSGENCYVSEGYCGEYQGTLIDSREFIPCPNGCSAGACISK